MSINIFKNKIGISLKTSFLSGIIVFIFLFITCLIFLIIELNLAKIITNENIKKVEKTIEEQGESQKDSFHQNLMVTAKILSSIASTFLYNVYPDGLKAAFISCMEISDILAIKVIDAGDNPFFAVWRGAKITTSEKISDDIKNLDEKFSFKADSYFEDKKIGVVQIYYTDDLISKKLSQNKKTAQTEILLFYKTINNRIKTALIIQFIVAIFVVLFLIGTLVIYLKISLIKPILKIVDFAKNMSAGDLTQRININQTDEIGILAWAMNKMARYLSEIIKKIIKSSRNLSRMTSNLLTSIEETSSSLEEISSMTKLNATNANHADKIMKQVIKFVFEVNESMTKLTNSMDDIYRANQQTSIIIKTINEIAFQTNILSLNAAVESARFGSAGAGFAVVANEVRNLAIRSAGAAKNTAEIIENTIKKVQDGLELVNVTNCGFKKIGIHSSSIANLLSEIASASNEQADSIGQINKAVSAMEEETQKNAANAQELALSISIFRVSAHVALIEKKKY